ncbi:hypothetical protein TIFTF001_030882 [Ficus carica]|uniref:Uncharacterized protein n=1 Tax=Ficus carica TaxID=3494 RepID=A0AA88J4R1_FICCA|nr:hypothetical protein TIFTF001_030882 [Ficus carica]
MKSSSPSFKRPASHYKALSSDSASRKPRTITEALVRVQGLIECEGLNRTPHAKGLNLDQHGSQFASRQRDNNRP